MDASTTTSRRSGRIREVMALSGFGLAYLLLQEMGLRLAFPPVGMAAFWPAAGVAVGVLAGRRRPALRGVLSVLAAVNVAGNVWHGNSWWSSVGFAVANTTGPAVGGYLLSRAGAARQARPAWWVLHGLLPAAVSSALVSAVIGAGVVVATGYGEAGLAGVWWRWFAADALGILAVAPAVLAVITMSRPRVVSWNRVFEAVALLAAQSSLVWLVFGSPSELLGPVKWPYLLLPGVFWAVMRFGGRATAVLSAGLTGAVVWGTAHGGGPFAQAPTPAARMLSAQLFCIVIFLSSVMMATVIDAHAEAKKRLVHQSAAMTHAVFGISYIGPDGRYQEINPAYAAQLGMTPDDLVGHSWDRTVHPDDLPGLHDAYQYMLDTGSVTAEARGVRADGTTFYKEVTMVTDRAEDGTLLGHHCFMRDVTERRTATEHVDRLFQLSPDLLCVIADGRFVRLNPAWQAVLGHPIADILDHSFLEFVHPDDAELTIAEGARVSSGAESLAFENRYRCADGSYRWLRWNSAADADGSLVYAVAHDITDSKLTEQVLADARDQALEATRMKSQFLATMSHEIRTPMNGVLGLTDLLAKTTLNDTQRRYVNGVRTAGDALLTVINDILDFSKIEAGKFVLDQVDFRLSGLLAEIAGFTRQAAENKGIALNEDLDTRLPEIVRGDPGRLRQILLNLIGNAVKFTHDGNVTLRAYPVRTGPRTEVCIEVIDTGIGMDHAALSRLFQAFQQADASTTRSYGGTGLGLAISRHLLEAMGGAITVDSIPDSGTTFRVTLPLPAVTGSAQITTAADPNQLRVLIVDTATTSNRCTLSDMVRSWGMHADAASDEEHAIELLRVAATHARRYDVAIIDMHLPGRNGVELADTINAHPAIPNLPVILLTAGEAIRPAQARQASIGATIVKPVNASTLFDALTTVTNPGSGETDDIVRGTLLLVEDNKINQMVAIGILTQLGYTVDIANDGLEALDKAARHPYQAILMDCQMPRMDGYTATARLRAQPATARTPIIAMTANVLQEERQQCLAAGMDDYLPKPIRADDLDATLRRWTGVAPVHQTADTSAGGSPIRDRLHELLGNYTAADTAFIQKLVHHFVNAAPAMIAELGAAISDADAPTIAYHAHALRGAASNLGADTLTRLSGTIEDLARTNDTTDVGVHHVRLGAALDQTITELTSTITTLCGPHR